MLKMFLSIKELTHNGAGIKWTIRELFWTGTLAFGGVVDTHCLHALLYKYTTGLVLLHQSLHICTRFAAVFLFLNWFMV